MSTQIGIGFSLHSDVEQAAKKAAFDAKTNLKADRIDLAIVFTSVHYDPIKTSATVNKILGSPKLIGSSTAGLILSDSVQTRGITIITICSDEIKFGINALENVDKNPAFDVGQALAHQSIQNLGPLPRQGFLFFMDNTLKESSLLIKGLQNAYGHVFPVVGAGSCDDFHFTHCYQYFKDRVLMKSVVGLLIGGHSSLGIAGRHGWKPLGKPRVINESSGNVITKIDGKSAVNLYEEYFEENAEDIRKNKLGRMAILYPLGVYLPESKQYLLRSAVDVRPDGSIVCRGDVPAGMEVHVMIGNKLSCQQAARDAAQEALRALQGKRPKLVIVMACLSRLKLLGRYAFQEIKSVKETFGDDVPIVGMYTDGEIYPIEADEHSKQSFHQNESIIVFAIS